MKRTLTTLALLAGTTTAGAAAAQTEISVLRVAINEEQEQYYEDIAQAFEAEHDGVDVNFEYIANEAYKSKLPTLLQSDARPDIFYSWGGQTLVQQSEAGFLQDISAHASGRLSRDDPRGRARCLYGRRQPLRPAALRHRGRALGQHDPDRGGGCRRRPDRDLGRFPRGRADAQGCGRDADHHRRTGQVAPAFLLELPRAARRRAGRRV